MTLEPLQQRGQIRQYRGLLRELIGQSGEHRLPVPCIAFDPRDGCRGKGIGQNNVERYPSKCVHGSEHFCAVGLGNPIFPRPIDWNYGVSDEQEPSPLVCP